MRYLPLTQADRAQMLKDIGVASADEFFKGLPVTKSFDLPDHQGELEVERFMAGLAEQNRSASSGKFFLGAGVYRHHIPSSVDYIIQRSEFLTSYTPYQPEIAQGTLQVIFEYQTMIARLTGQDVANASMYDGATSCAEAALMAMRLTGREKIVVGNQLHPQYREVLEAYAGHNIVDGMDDSVAAMIIQSPDFYGTPHTYEEYKKQCDAVGAKLIVVITEIVSLGLLEPPSIADIVCGEAQSIGIPMSYGGPYLGFFACKQEYLRQMPGRLCGETVDADGRRSFVLTLSTREQHIRREKATSNICTNQGLCALAFTVHAALLGEQGFKDLARLNHERACDLADALSAIKGVTIENTSFFNEFVVVFEKPAKELILALAHQDMIPGLRLDEHRLLVCATEMTTDADIQALTNGLKEALNG
jgi:glycine dehydrogenase subunit 1